MLDNQTPVNHHDGVEVAYLQQSWFVTTVIARGINGDAPGFQRPPGDGLGFPISMRRPGFLEVNDQMAFTSWR